MVEAVDSTCAGIVTERLKVLVLETCANPAIGADSTTAVAKAIRMGIFFIASSC